MQFQLDHDRAPLWDGLIEWGERGVALAAVPGHGTNVAPELTRVFGPYGRFDATSTYHSLDVKNVNGLLWQAQDLAADLFGAQAAVFSGQGATLVVQALIDAVKATVGQDAVWAVQDASHCSAFAGLRISGIKFRLLESEIYPPFGCPAALTADTLVRELADHPEIKVVWTTSVIYEGFGADTQEIGAVCRKHNVVWVDDISWASLSSLHPSLPEMPTKLGAAASVISTHKSWGNYNETAIAAVGQDSRIPVELVRGAFIDQTTTSPALPLLASIDWARRRLAQQGPELIERMIARIDRLSGILHDGGVPPLTPDEIVGHYGVQNVMPNIIVVPTGMSGHTGYGVYDQVLRRSGIELSAGQPRNVQVQFGVDASEEQITEVFRAIVDGVTSLPPADPLGPAPILPRKRRGLIDLSGVTPPVEMVRYWDAVDRICAATYTAYPPGRPEILAGEVVTEAALRNIETVRNDGGHVRGGGDPTLEKMAVYKR